MGVFWGVAKISNIYLEVLEISFFLFVCFFGGRG